MRRSKVIGLLALLPLFAMAAGSVGLIDRVPIPPSTLAEAQSGFNGLQAEANALRADLDAAQSELDAIAETNAASDEKRAQQQASDLEAAIGMSMEEMSEADEDEIAEKMLGGMGMSMADMEAVADMDDAEAEAYFANKQGTAKPTNNEGLQKLASNQPSAADAEKFERLNREFTDWNTKSSEQKMRAIEEHQALNARWASEHAQLNTGLDAELASRARNVPLVDCGEAGEYPDVIQVHSIELERATAHAKLAPQQFQQGVDYLASRRESVKADAAFVDKFAADAQGVDMMHNQSYSAQVQVLLSIEELLNQTVEITRDLLSWDAEKARLESISPKSSCG